MRPVYTDGFRNCIELTGYVDFFLVIVLAVLQTFALSPILDMSKNYVSRFWFVVVIFREPFFERFSSVFVHCVENCNFWLGKGVVVRDKRRVGLKTKRVKRS